MAYECFVDRDLNVGLLRLSGHVDAEEIRKAARAVYQDADWAPHYASLWDFCPTREVEITPAGIEDILQLKSDFDAEGILQGKVAGIIDRPLIMIFGKLIELRASSAASPVKAFRQERRARQWMNLPEEEDLWRVFR